MTGLAERAAGALYGLAVGDALGMPTESLPRPEIVARYGPLLEEFQPGPPGQPLAAGLPARPGDAAGLSGYSLVHPSNRGALLGWLARLPAENTVVFDPGPVVASIPPGALDVVLGRADWLTCNAREAAALTGEDRPAAALRALAGRLATRGRPGARVLVRTGPGGCLLSSFSATEPLTVPGFPVTELDSNGAGDTHTGVFIAALAAGANAGEAARWANAAATISVTRRGPATAPTAAELAQFLSRVLNTG